MKCYQLVPVICAAMAAMSGLGECCAQDFPQWTATADALFLNRSDPAARVLAFNTETPSERLSADDFHFGFHTGFDVALRRQLHCNSALEIRYFGIDGWNAAVAAPTTPGQLLQVNTAVPIFTDTGDAIQADYRSELHNAELSLRHQILPCVDLLAGFRYVELNEHAAARLVNADVPFDYEITARNRLYGFQLGSEALLWRHGEFSLDAVGKAGIFGNQAAQHSVVDTGTVVLPASGRGNRAAFVGELGINSRVQVTEHLSLRGGYRLLWVSGAALATEQVPVSDFVDATGFDASGDVFYHGVFVGGQFQW